MNAGKPFTERMGGPGKEPDLDNDPRVNKHGKKDHEKVTLYEDGIPETIGRKTVEEMFEGKGTVILNECLICKIAGLPFFHERHSWLIC